MSIVIKSNNAYTGEGSLPTIAQLTQTQQQAFDAFKTRVLADGGQIGSEQKIKEAINFIYSENLFGKTSVCASPHYAYKLDSSSKLLKLYSIDGQDLETVRFDGGDLPTLSNNKVVFSDTNNTGILTTVYKNWAVKTGRLYIATTASDVTSPVAAYNSGMTKHDGTPPVSGNIFDIMAQSSGVGELRAPRASTVYGGSNDRKAFSAGVYTTNNSIVSWIDSVKGQANMIIAGVDNGTPLAIAIDDRFRTEKHYIDFGGRWSSTNQYNAGIQYSAIWIMEDITQEQAIAVNKFQSANYD